MYSDSDMKIAGDKPSVDVIRNAEFSSLKNQVSSDKFNRAKKWGTEVARKFAKAINENSIGGRESNHEMLEQRRILLSFAAAIGFETLADDDTIGGLAQKNFLDSISKQEPKHNITAKDNGAFSFYYLAFRRGNDVERRIGQTFAMLCSHDGDPIYQELGEALYCWFLSEVKASAKEQNII